MGKLTGIHHTPGPTACLAVLALAVLIFARSRVGLVFAIDGAVRLPLQQHVGLEDASCGEAGKEGSEGDDGELHLDRRSVATWGMQFCMGRP